MEEALEVDNLEKNDPGFGLLFLAKESEVAYGTIYYIVLPITSYKVRDN